MEEFISDEFILQLNRVGFILWAVCFIIGLIVWGWYFIKNWNK